MLNKAMIIGNLGADPEMRYTQSGTAVANFNVATTERYTNNAGERVEETEWHKVVAWQRLAEICADYLTKGSRVYIEGKIQTRKWQDQNGNDRYTTEIVAREMKMLSDRQQGTSVDAGSTNGADPIPEDVPF
jgi:single-strand DNA-binding protein